MRRDPEDLRRPVSGGAGADGAMHTLILRAKDVYRSLPPGIRGTAASAYGWYLNWWRYGRDTDALVAAALDRDGWSAERLGPYSEERLTVLLHRAATQVPFYREMWRTRRAAGDMASWGELANWPLLEKDALRRNPRAFLADDARPGRMFRMTTSGTSGAPIITWRSRGTMTAWYALVEARMRQWYGVDRHVPWAILGGQVVTPADQRDPPFWVWNAGLRQLYMSSLHLNARHVAGYLEAMRKHDIRYLYGYTSAMYWLACLVRDEGLAAPKLDVVISNAEPLLPHQRAAIGDVFGCPVRNTYGMSEIVAAASECEAGTLHVWPEAGVIEVLGDEDGTPVPVGVSGRLVCTGLLNPDMPLVRYVVGDRGAWRLEDEHDVCGCGRRLPALARIEGRTNDNLVTKDGRRVYWVNSQFYDLPIREGQVIQEGVDLIHVNVVPDVGFDDRVERVIEKRMRQRLGDVRVVIHRLDHIPREASGKFRAVINQVVGDR